MFALLVLFGGEEKRTTHAIGVNKKFFDRGEEGFYPKYRHRSTIIIVAFDDPAIVRKESADDDDDDPIWVAKERRDQRFFLSFRSKKTKMMMMLTSFMSIVFCASAWTETTKFLVLTLDRD